MPEWLWIEHSDWITWLRGIIHNNPCLIQLAWNKIKKSLAIIYHFGECATPDLRFQSSPWISKWWRHQEVNYLSLTIFILFKLKRLSRLWPQNTKGCLHPLVYKDWCHCKCQNAELSMTRGVQLTYTHINVFFRIECMSHCKSLPIFIIMQTIRKQIWLSITVLWIIQTIWVIILSALCTYYL